MQKLGLYLVALIVLGGLVYVIYTNAPRLPEQQIGGDAAPAQGRDIAIHESTTTYKIDVTYRHFGIPSLDSQVDAQVQELIDGFKKQVQEYPPVEDSVVQQYTLSGEMADQQVGDAIASIRINFYEYTGGAHGLPLVMTLNYDAKSGAELTLSDALALTGKTLEAVAADSLSQLTREYGDSVFADGATAEEDNYQTFLVSPQKVTFIFQAYQVVPYAAGMPEVGFSRVQ